MPKEEGERGRVTERLQQKINEDGKTTPRPKEYLVA